MDRTENATNARGPRRRWVACVTATAAALIGACWGCGGGGAEGLFGIGGEDDAEVCRTAYTPSYVSDLEALRRWDRLPVRVWIGTNTRYGNGETLEDRMRDGFSAWAAATRGRAGWIEVDDPGDADVRARIEVRNGANLLPDGGRTLAITETQFFVGENRLQGADVVVYAWRGMTARDVSYLSVTSTHEMGHVLGITGHSPDPADVMYRSSNRSGELTERDVNTVRSAYCGFTRAAARRGRAADAGKELRTHTIRCD